MTEVPEIAPEAAVLPEAGASTRSLADEERARKEAEALAAVGPLVTLTVVLQAKTGDIRVNGPSDPVIALGMLESAKFIIARGVGLTREVDGEPAPSKLVVPAGMPLQFLRRRR